MSDGEPNVEQDAVDEAVPYEIIVNLPQHNPDPRTWRRVPEVRLDAEGRMQMTGRMITTDESGTEVPLM